MLALAWLSTRLGYYTLALSSCRAAISYPRAGQFGFFLGELRYAVVDSEAKRYTPALMGLQARQGTEPDEASRIDPRR